MTEPVSPHEPSALPPFLVPYLPQFRALLDDLELIDGFVLYPVDLAGPDLARGLADWLRAQGKKAILVHPETDDALRQMTAHLLSLTPAPDEVVVFAGPSVLDADAPLSALDEGLHLINQRRDSIKAALGVPLLWCGPREFQRTTAERAPDFWSIRDLGGKLRAPSEKEVFQLPGTLGFPSSFHRTEEDPDELSQRYREARRQGDYKNAVRLAVRLSLVFDFRAQSQDALRLLDEAIGLHPAMLVKDNPLRARVLEAKTSLFLSAGLFQEAKTLLESEVLPHARRKGHRRNVAITLAKLATARARLGDHPGALRLLQREVIPMLRLEGDLEASAVHETMLASELIHAGNPTEASTLLQSSVLPYFRRTGDARSTAMASELLARTWRRSGRLDEAIHAQRDIVLRTFDSLGDLRSSVSARSTLADMLVARGAPSDLLDARTLLVQALREARRHQLPNVTEIEKRLSSIAKRP